MNDQILAVQRMQDYMAEHCAEPVTMSDLARAAGYSLKFIESVLQKRKKEDEDVQEEE